MFELPTSITVKDRTFSITNNGDFRMILDCFSALSDNELSEDYRVLASLLIFYNEFNSIDDVVEDKDILQDLIQEMFKFINCGSMTSPGAETHRNLVDWEGDQQMICSAVNNVARTEIRALPYLHWWTFMGYYSAVGESVFANVVSIRNKIVRHKKLEKWEKDFKKDNPHYFVWKSETVLDKEVEDIVREIWNQGGS